MPITVQFLKVIKHRPDIIKEIRTIRMAGKLGELPAIGILVRLANQYIPLGG